MTNARALLFDFGGTLDRPVHWLDRFVAHYRACGLAIDRDELDPAFEHATRTAYGSTAAIREMGLRETVLFLVRDQLEHLRCLGPEHLRQRLEHIGPSGVEQLRDRIGAGFAEETRGGTAGNRELLLDLKTRFRLGVVSNFYGNLERVLAEARILELMDAVVDSAAVGIFKPDPRIFSTALAALGGSIKPAEVAMIGDSPDKDCAPARIAGLKSVWLCNPPQRMPPQPAETFADYKINALDELLKLPWANI